MDVHIRPIASPAELVRAFDVAGQQLDPPISHTDRRFTAVQRAFEDDGPLMQAAIRGSEIIGVVLAFRRGGDNAVLRIAAVHTDHRGSGIGRRLVDAVEQSARECGVVTISLGADAAVGFWHRLGYDASVYLQWVVDPAAAEREIEAVLAEPLNGHDGTRWSTDGVPQLSVRVPCPDPTLINRLRRVAPGAEVGYLMIKHLRPVQERRDHCS